MLHDHHGSFFGPTRSLFASMAADLPFDTAGRMREDSPSAAGADTLLSSAGLPSVAGADTVLSSAAGPSEVGGPKLV